MQVKKYFEKKVSLLSTSDVRYDGELYTVDPSEQSIALKHVNCMGTEGRRTGDQVIPPSDCTYEFIIFRAVNIRELWLDQESGRRVDLTDEILLPLRSGQNVNANYNSAPKQRPDVAHYEAHDAPKRKVGYQSRSSSQQQRGYDPYYQQAAPPPPQRGGYDNYGGGGYQRQYQQPPPPQQQYHAPPPQTYYDTPNQSSYYYNNRQGSPYRQQRQYSNQYRQQRAPQYYNYNQGYPQHYGGYQQQRNYGGQQRRYNQQQRNYGGQQRRYNNYNQGQRQARGRRQGSNQAGTGAFLDNRRLRGQEIDIKDQQDFDFGAAKNEFDSSKEVQANGGVIEAQYSEDVEADNVQRSSEAKANADEEDIKVSDEDKKQKQYDKTKSFFDGLETETKKSKPKQDLQTQKDVDTKTFGSVAATYKSRHINRPNQGRYGNRNRGYQQNYNRNRGYQQQNRPRYYNNEYAQQQTPHYTTNKWVVRR